jgi:hypothetical protein
MSGFYGLYWYFEDTGTGSQPIFLEGTTTVEAAPTHPKQTNDGVPND